MSEDIKDGVNLVINMVFLSDCMVLMFWLYLRYKQAPQEILDDVFFYGMGIAFIAFVCRVLSWFAFDEKKAGAP